MPENPALLEGIHFFPISHAARIGTTAHPPGKRSTHSPAQTRFETASGGSGAGEGEIGGGYGSGARRQRARAAKRSGHEKLRAANPDPEGYDRETESAAV